MQFWPSLTGDNRSSFEDKMQGQRVMWKDMRKPVSLEEHAGAPIAPTPRPDLPTDVSESVTIQAERPPGEGDDWEVRAYFTDPQNLGSTAGPLPAVHTGFKMYRGGKFQFSLDAGPSGPHLTNMGNLRFQNTEKELDTNKRGIAEFRIEPPKGVTGKDFANRLATAAERYDGSRPYSLPDLEQNPSSYKSIWGGPDPDPIGLRFGNAMRPGEYNSNSFAAGVLEQAGAGVSLSAIRKYLGGKFSAPGLEQPLPNRYFRSR